MIEQRYDNRNPEPTTNAASDEAVNSEEDYWLKKATDAYITSTDYCRTNVWRQWRKNLCHFRNQHDYATRYAQKGYKGRSKIFRPKTRASIRNAEAAFARALFSNQDLVNITAGDSGSEDQRVVGVVTAQ